MTGRLDERSTVVDRRGIRRGNGVGRSSQRLLPSRDGRSGRTLSAEPFADPRRPRRGRARTRGRDAADAADDRHARRPILAEAAGAIRRLRSASGTFCYYVFLRIICGWPKSLFDWDILFLLPLPWWGPVLAPVSIASADDRVGHGDHAGRGSISNELASVDRVGLRRNRHRPGAVRLHGRCSPHDRPGSGRHQAGPPDVIRMDVVLGCARADGCAGGTVRMANAVTPAGALVLTGSNA